MIRTESQFQFWTLVQWRCHGHLWELLLSPKFPERYNWAPVCEDCNKEKTMNEMAPNTTPATVEVHTDFADLPDFIKQAIKDGKPVEIQTDEEVGKTEETLH